MTEILNDIERADIAVAEATAPVEETRLGHALGLVGKLGDQPPLRVLCGAVVATGWWRDDPRLVLAGVRMFAAHTLATLAKTRIKKRVDRSRPNVLLEEGHYEAHPGDNEDHDVTSFPSGHTAGAVAVAAAVARSYPAAALPAAGAALLLSGVQVPRRAHYVSDVVAGAAIGLLAERLLAVAWPASGRDRDAAVRPTGTKRVHRPY